MLREMEEEEGEGGVVLTLVSRLREIITINLPPQTGNPTLRIVVLVVPALAAGGSTVHRPGHVAASHGTGRRLAWSGARPVRAAAISPPL